MTPLGQHPGHDEMAEGGDRSLAAAGSGREQGAGRGPEGQRGGPGTELS